MIIEVTYALSGRLVLEAENLAGQLVLRASLDGRPLRLSEELVGALLCLLSGGRPSLRQLDGLLCHNILVPLGAPPLPEAGRLRLQPTVAIEVWPSPQVAGGRLVRPVNSLPIGLFVPPEILGSMQRMAATLTQAFRRMASAALSRGRMPEPGPAARILAELALELFREDPILPSVFQVESPFRLRPRLALQDDVVHYPIEELRIHRDRSAPGPPLSLRLRGPVSRYGLWLGRLSSGAPATELAAAAPADDILWHLLGALAGLLHPETEPPRPLSLPPGGVLHLGHASLLCNLDGHYVLVDPWLPPASHGDATPPPAPAALPPLSAIFLTHHHWDHVHLETLLKLDKSVPVYLPRQDESRPLRPRTDLLLAYVGFSDLRPIAPGDRIPFGDRGAVQAVPFFGEDPTLLGYRGCCYVLEHDGQASLVHVDSSSDVMGRSLVSSGAAAELVARHGPLCPVFATRRQERGMMVEHTWEFLLQPAEAWVLPTENCCNDAAFLAELCQHTRTPLLVLYSEGGADWYPNDTDFLRRGQPSARMAPYEYLCDDLATIAASLARVGTALHLSVPWQTYRIGSPQIEGQVESLG
ncbi:MAG: MBL fold metallo-hydrolase [Myxococcota bacterium]|nr:MBL fold metallo-hydrolase [Myxococcota bacterium]